MKTRFMQYKTYLTNFVKKKRPSEFDKIDFVREVELKNRYAQKYFTCAFVCW